MHEYYIYIMTNGVRTLYTDVTNDLMRRVFEHKEKLVDRFTKKYNITMLVYYETTGDIQATIAREKQLKAGGEARRLLSSSHRIPSGKTSPWDGMEDRDFRPLSALGVTFQDSY